MNNKATRSFLLLIAIFTVGFAACNYTDGECWYYGEGSENAGASVGVGPGGGVIVPTGPAGVGGFGDSPPKQPQDATNPAEPPVCNIVSLSPCHDKCDEEDEARAIECAKIQDEAQRRACNDSSHEKYKSCIEECEKGPADACWKKWERCTNYAPFAECASKKSGNGKKSRCDLCREQCSSGTPPSLVCKKCLF
jgi:hypothetical protein